MKGLHSKFAIVLTIVGLILATGLSGCRSAAAPVVVDPPANSSPVFLATPDTGQAQNAVPTPAEEAVVENGLGELYFVANDIQQGTLELRRLPGECLIGRVPCPEAELVPGFPNVDESVRPLVWSPDGSRALLPHGEFLYLFDPASSAWTPVAQSRVTDLPEWSPDGGRIAWIGQSGNASDVMAASPDGSGLQNLTGGRYTGQDWRLAAVSWISPTTVSFWVFTPGQPKEMLQMNVDTGEVTPLVQMSALTKDVFAFSPDRQRAAVESFVDGDSRLLLGSADGSDLLAAGAYGAASIWPLSWSSDGGWVAYAVYQSPDVDPLTRVYIVPGDGSQEAREVLQLSAVSAIVWSPDSQTLVVQGDRDGVSGLYAVQVETGEANLVAIPGIEGGVMVQGVSWR